MAKRGVGLVVERAETVVEEEDARVGRKRTCDSEALPLTAGDVRASLSDGAFKAFGLLADELARLGNVGRTANPLVVGAFRPIGDIARNRTTEQKRLLGNVAELPAQRVLAHIAHVNAVDGDASLADIVEPKRQLHDGRLPAARAADDGCGLSGLAREIDVVEDVLGGIGVAETHVVERNLGTGITRGRKFSILRNGGVGIADRGLAFEHFLDALGRDIGAREHDREHADHEEAHDDDHRVGDERDEVACLERARVDGMAAEPHDADRHKVHDEHHKRHHERHDAVREQLRFHQARARLVEAILLMLLAVERPHDRKAHEHLARHEVHAVDQLLHDLELRHGDLDEHHEDERDREHGDDDDQTHREVGARDHDDAADCEDGRVENHAQQHHGDHLDLLDIVGPTRNQRRRAKRLNFSIREGDDLVEKPPAQGSSHLRRSSRREETD